MAKVFTEDNALELAEKLLQNDKNIKDEFEQKGYVTESFVTTAIANAQLSGGDVDLSDYASKEDLNDKATKATTIAGYGITDAYTKTEVDTVKNDVNAYADGLNTAMNARVATLENLVGGGFSSIQTASISALFN